MKLLLGMGNVDVDVDLKDNIGQTMLSRAYAEWARGRRETAAGDGQGGRELEGRRRPDAAVVGRMVRARGRFEAVARGEYGGWGLAEQYRPNAAVGAALFEYEPS
jgi:hypothetical protein